MNFYSANEDFREIAEQILAANWRFYPDVASRMGLHEYDGGLPDISPRSLSSRAHRLHQWLLRLAEFDPQSLDRQGYFDYRILSGHLRKELFEITELRTFATNPMDAQWHIELSNYILRDYAPLDERVSALTAALERVPEYLRHLKAHNDTAQIGRPVLETAIESYEGIAKFYREDMPTAIEKAGSSVRTECHEAIAMASDAVDDYVQYLRSRELDATDDFAIGAEKFRRLLQYGEFVDIPLRRLIELGEEDLARNQARMRQVSAQIGFPNAPHEAMKAMEKDHPTADQLIAETRGQLESVRKYLIDHDIVTVPSEERCAVTETPSFMRWATAAMDFPGPYETKATNAFYYVTPVEPDWSAEKAEQWLSIFNYSTLRSVNVHEAYPGHFLHYLHTRSAPSKISVVFGAYSFWEGWAHYVEEMMVEQGFGEDDRFVSMGQIAEALLRTSRFLCSIRMHTEGMSVEEATQFIEKNAYMEKLPAHKEALRGTFDPMYLNYTLGKLMILKLREDYRAEKGEGFSLREFHDALLALGAPPLPLAREMLIRDQAQPVL